MPARSVPLLIAFAVFVLDRLSKTFIKTHFSAFETVRVIPGFFNIVHAENPGVAFGLLADSTGAWRGILLVGLSAGILVFIAFLLWRPNQSVADPWLRVALSLIMGGALGNLFDRIANGTVTDFVEVYAGQFFFPAFNVADSAITVGACLLLFDMWRGRGRKLTPQSIDVP